jgi:uncharacterized protein
MRKKWWLLIAVLIILDFLFFVTKTVGSSPTIRIGQLVIPVELARSSTEMQKGLSGRESLPTNSGMLFIFPRLDFYHFWMPDMHFPIDIIWLDQNKKIIDISSNIPNNFDPKNPVIYQPKQPAQYVLEVNAGFAQNHQINIGDLVVFEGIDKK